MATVVRSMLFRVGAADPTIYVLAGLFLAAVALLATGIPAFRAEASIRCGRSDGECASAAHVFVEDACAVRKLALVEQVLCRTR